jgi:hypothetical protein
MAPYYHALDACGSRKLDGAAAFGDATRAEE